MLKPPYSRILTFDKTLELLSETPTIVEFGMTRQEGNYDGDGYSTILFGWYVVEHGGKFISVDIDPNNIVISHRILKQYEIPTENIYLTCGDATNFLKLFPIENIDLIYLDAWDWIGTEEEKQISENAHLEVFYDIEPKLSDNALILIDDIWNRKTYDGKGKLLIPYLLKNDNYELIIADYQFLFQKRRKII
jgi:hypothetical protein